MRRKDALLFGFIQLVEENFHTERSVAYYAERLFVSPKTSVSHDKRGKRTHCRRLD